MRSETVVDKAGTRGSATRGSGGWRERAGFGGKALYLARVAAFYAALLLLWKAIYELQVWSPFLFPEPKTVHAPLHRYIDNRVLFDSIRVTMQRMLIGFAIAFAPAWPSASPSAP